MKKGLENKEEYDKYKKWFKKNYPDLPFIIHPNFVTEYNQDQENWGWLTPEKARRLTKPVKWK
jgi:hypothetical protein